MTNPDWVEMDDDAFEAAMENSPEEESTEEPLEEAQDDSQEELDESPSDDVESSEEAATETTEDFTDEEPEEGVEEEQAEDEPEETEESEPDESETAEDDPLAELYKPFKASGREVQIKSVEEAKKLMSMGVDYSNKLQGFKQHRKTIKMLENNEIDEAKLNYFIDLSKGNPEAIKQLLKDNELDPMDMDLEEDSSYKPSDYSVSDNAVELDDVISRIQETTTFSTTSDIVTNQWDASSKQAIFAEPTLLENLNEHVANGTFERVMQEVDRAKLFGGLQGLSDLEAYNQVGAQLQKQGEIGQAPAPKVVATKPTQAVNTNKDRKLRASSSKPTRKTKAAPQNWAAMSDADFEKLLKGE
jgi:hypothetical protein